MSGNQFRPVAAASRLRELDRRLVAEFVAPSRIGILLFPGVEELDAVGPWEVLAFWTRTFPEDHFEVFCVSQDGQPVTCARGLVIAAHHSYNTMPPLAVLLHPGGKGVYPPDRQQESPRVAAAAKEDSPAASKRVHRSVGLRSRWSARWTTSHHVLECA